MQQRVTMIGLGVADLPRARAFYARLGWEEAQPDSTDIAFFNLQNSVLSLYPWDKMAEDIGIAPEDFGQPTACLAYNVNSPAEVAATLAEAEAAGATIVKQAQNVFWGGHSGYFRDPDGHFWEVAHNPFSPLGPNGEARVGGFQ
ncbi:MAG: VOC family protein [Marivivens sp.]|nr:VOC family protein [Marivivens sp.]